MPSFSALMLLVCALFACMTNPAAAQDETAAEATAPAPPSNVQAADHPLDGAKAIDVTWTLSPDDGDKTKLVGYRVYRTMTPKEIEDADAKAVSDAKKSAKAKVTDAWREELKANHPDARLADLEKDPAYLENIRTRRQEAAAAAETKAKADIEAKKGETRWMFVTVVNAGTSATTVDGVSETTKLEDDSRVTNTYQFAVEAIGPTGLLSSKVSSATPMTPSLQWFDGSRIWLAIITFILCGSVVAFIGLARTGIPLKVRKIAGLEAVDEAVGRATEMGRSCLFIPGIQDMNDIQTIAGLTVLSRVAKTAAEYDAKIEVPTSRSLVMTTARETVQSAFLTAGRPDAYNEDLIYYVTDEQFGYVAYLSGMMVREKPAACFYMGAFFAESLILAETGNSIGAIQVAGTAQPSQLPFFVAACDYTLIGEEFFAASAYLSGSPEELGSLKGQDVGKVLVAVGIVAGVLFATLAAIAVLSGNDSMADTFKGLESFIRETMLT